ncbi:hypothetical protein [Acidocella sp.]|uniref:hypothetical protein n=1 Tax=Acidocella sp. TaxID=50710 RepID=UPI00260879FB|nr:hypothetical protein [Acidocella sp.]
MTLPVIFVWLAILGALALRRDMILYLFNATIAFGGMTLLPPGLTGGLNLPAQTVCAALMIGLCLLDPALRARIVLWALDIHRLGLLALFGVFSALSALILPRLFAGIVQVYALNAAASESPLYPTSANFSQMIYVLVSTGMVFVVAASSMQQGFLQRYLNSVVVAGIMLVFSGIIDFAFGAAGHEDFLAGFHNASYNLLDDEMIAGTKRIVGFMPEASVYGDACCCILAFLLFNYSLYTDRIRRMVLPPVIMLLIILTIESTASTGYLGLIAIAGLQGLRLAARANFMRWTGGRRFGLVQYILGGIVGISIIVIAVPASWWAHLELLFNLMLVDKTTTSSYLQRSAWTQSGWTAFYATHGLGAGIGSIRTSNWFVNILASTGVIGTTLFFMFVFSSMFPVGRTVAEPLRRLRRGTMLALIPAALMIAVSGTTPDPGVWIMSLFGILYGVKLAPREVPGIMGRAGISLPVNRAAI